MFMRIIINNSGFAIVNMLKKIYPFSLEMGKFMNDPFAVIFCTETPNLQFSLFSSSYSVLLIYKINRNAKHK